MKPPSDVSRALSGWSMTMRRWLAYAQSVEPALRIVATVNDGDLTLQVALDEISAVRVHDLAQVLDHSIADHGPYLTSHVVRFVGGGELRYACDHHGRLLELATMELQGSVSDDGAVTFSVPKAVASPV